MWCTVCFIVSCPVLGPGHFQWMLWTQINTLLWGIKPIVPGSTIKILRAEAREEHNVMFFGYILSKKVLRVIMLHWCAKIREVSNLFPTNCQSTKQWGISTFITVNWFKLFFFFQIILHSTQSICWILVLIALILFLLLYLLGIFWSDLPKITLLCTQSAQPKYAFTTPVHIMHT